jgi:phage terminase large subunit
MAELQIDVARAFRPLLDPSRYKAAYGGRGSGKSQFFAGEVIALCIRKPGLRVLCCREIQKSLKESAKRLLEQKIEEYGVGHLFEVQDAQIKAPGGGLIVFAGLAGSHGGIDQVIRGLRRCMGRGGADRLRPLVEPAPPDDPQA